jgi:hypothetical protein
VLLMRDNGLARVISESDLRVPAWEKPEKTVAFQHSGAATQLPLVQLQQYHAQWLKRRQRYAAAFSRLEQWGIPVMRISYERLLEVPETMIEVMRFVGADVSEVAVDNAAGVVTGPGWMHPLYSTRWHINTTRYYLANADEVSSWLQRGELPGWEPCMLHNDCPTQLPLVGGAPHSADSQARAQAAKQAAAVWAEERTRLLRVNAGRRTHPPPSSSSHAVPSASVQEGVPSSRPRASRDAAGDGPTRRP